MKPPLMEFEETLLSGAGVAVAKERTLNDQRRSRAQERVEVARRGRV